MFATECVRQGVIVHPRHNWFMCAAHTDADVDAALAASDVAFAAVRAQFGESRVAGPGVTA